MNALLLANKTVPAPKWGGVKPEGEKFQAGNFLLPTLFVDVLPSMKIAREEIFGPVVSVMSWDQEEAMLGHVNELEFGLTTSIWSNNINHALHAAGRIEAGYIWINHVGSHFLGAPYGGQKNSGLGSTGCLDELLNYLQFKNIHISIL